MLAALGFDVALEDFVADGVARGEPPIVWGRGGGFAGEGTLQAVEDNLLHFLGGTLDKSLRFWGALLRATGTAAAGLAWYFRRMIDR
jgi:hypothetical protein